MSVSHLLPPAIQHQVKPGDVFAFSGTDLPADVVKFATHSPYVHVAIVYANYHPEEMEKGCVLIAESHVDLSLASVGTGKKQLGVQLQWLCDRIQHSNGPVWWAPLAQPLTPTGQQSMHAWLQTIEKAQVPYDFVQAIGVGLEKMLPTTPVKNSPNYRALFCSELVTHALQRAGVINTQLDPADQSPADVMKFDCFKPIVQIRP